MASDASPKQRKRAVSAIKKSEYSSAIHNRNLIGPLEGMIENHAKKIINKINNEEMELTGGKTKKFGS